MAGQHRQGPRIGQTVGAGYLRPPSLPGVPEVHVEHCLQAPEWRFLIETVPLCLTCVAGEGFQQIYDILSSRLLSSIFNLKYSI